MGFHETLIADCYRAAKLPWPRNVVYASASSVALLIAVLGAGRHCLSWTDSLVDPNEDPLDMSALLAISEADEVPGDSIWADNLREELSSEAEACEALEPINRLAGSLYDETCSVAVDLADWGKAVDCPNDPLLGDLHAMELNNRSEERFRESLGDGEYRVLQAGLSRAGAVETHSAVGRIGVLYSDAEMLWSARFRGASPSGGFSWWPFPWFAVVNAPDH